jgi:hypothetical protein
MVGIQDWYDVGFEFHNAVRDELSKRRSYNDEEAQLIRMLSWDIVWRWKEKARHADDPSETFNELYDNGRTHAVGAIIAIIELVRKVGTGEPLLSEADSWIVAQLKKESPC